MASKFHIEMVDGPAARELRLHGIFDGTSAWEVRRAVSKQPQHLPLVIDFTDVDQIFDFGLAILLAGRSGRGWRAVEIVSVRPEWLRRFSCFGLEGLIRDPELSAAAAPHTG